MSGFIDLWGGQFDTPAGRLEYTRPDPHAWRKPKPTKADAPKQAVAQPPRYRRQGDGEAIATKQDYQRLIIDALSAAIDAGATAKEIADVFRTYNLKSVPGVSSLKAADIDHVHYDLVMLSFHRCGTEVPAKAVFSMW